MKNYEFTKEEEASFASLATDIRVIAVVWTLGTLGSALIVAMNFSLAALGAFTFGIIMSIATWRARARAKAVVETEGDDLKYTAELFDNLLIYFSLQAVIFVIAFIAYLYFFFIK